MSLKDCVGMAKTTERFLGLEIHHDWRTERSYPKSPPDGDGQEADVQVARYPAAFYRVVVHEGSDSVGGIKPGFVLATGSGMSKLAHEIAKAVSEGMLALGKENG